MKISIITPTLNSQQYLEQTISSIIEQNIDNLEYIIVDGGSTDGTHSILNKFRQHIDYIIEGKDKHMYDAINKGIAASTGDVIAYINSDDLYQPGALKKVVKSFEHEYFDVFFGNCTFFTDSGYSKTYRYPVFDLQRFKNTDFALIAQPASFFSKKCIEDIGGFNEAYSMAADYEFFLRAGIKEKKFKRENQIMARFRMHDQSLSSKFKDINLKEMMKIHFDNGIDHDYKYQAKNMLSKIKFKLNNF